VGLGIGPQTGGGQLERGKMGSWVQSWRHVLNPTETAWPNLLLSVEFFSTTTDPARQMDVQELRPKEKVLLQGTWIRWRRKKSHLKKG